MNGVSVPGSFSITYNGATVEPGERRGLRGGRDVHSRGRHRSAAEPSHTTITITKADAVVTVTGETFTYDGQEHGATGSATGAAGENLTSLLTLGEKFKNVPGGTANWTSPATRTTTRRMARSRSPSPRLTPS